MKELTLPEWVFLDGNTHLGDTLKGRDVFLHVRSNTVFEVFMKNEVFLNERAKHKGFQYLNEYGIMEDHIIAVHYSFVDDYILNDIIDKAIEFYKKYLEWEDKNILEDDKATRN